MDISGEYRLRADRQAVWDALHNTDNLKACIPGCEEIEKVADDEVMATVSAAIGPVKSRFKTKITLSNLNPPESYTMSGDGKGGAAGFGKGSANITLEEDGGGTLLHYRADFKVGGKLAQVGSRLVVGATRKMADQFFDCFAERIGAAPPEAVEAAEAGPAAPAAAGPGQSVRIVLIVGAVLVALLLLWLLAT